MADKKNTETIAILSRSKSTKISDIAPYATYNKTGSKEYADLKSTITQITKAQFGIVIGLLRYLKKLFIYNVSDAKTIFYTVLSIERLISQENFPIRQRDKFKELTDLAHAFAMSGEEEMGEALVDKYQDFLDEEFRLKSVEDLCAEIKKSAVIIQSIINKLADPKSILEKNREANDYEDRYGTKDEDIKKMIDGIREKVEEMREKNRKACTKAEKLSKIEVGNSKRLEELTEGLTKMEERDAIIKQAVQLSIRAVAQKKAERIRMAKANQENP
ncbi:MAG: hypothetical protein CMH62_03035 [Nanoarchaeota archaeon]|nr:hypothetical protein [Nanoarchaeota archaeon]|tara:strand:+ start:512 stop:1333 length:822 start_codon:yes stop_codon:yes gene_type:complete